MAKKKKTKYWKSAKNTVHHEGYAEGKTAYREITGRALVLKLIRPVLIKLLRRNKMDEINLAEESKLVPEKYQSEEEIKNDFLAGYFGPGKYYLYRRIFRGEPEIPTKEKVAERILLAFYMQIYDELVALDGEQDAENEKKTGMRKREKEKRSSPDEVLEAAKREAEAMYEEQKAAGSPPEDFDPYAE